MLDREEYPPLNLAEAHQRYASIMHELSERISHGTAPKDHAFGIGFHDGYFYVIAMPYNCLFRDLGQEKYYLGSIDAWYVREDGTLGEKILAEGDFKLMIDGNRWEWE